MTGTHFIITRDIFGFGREAPRDRGVFKVDEIGGAYRGYFAPNYPAAVSLAGTLAINAGSASSCQPIKQGDIDAAIRGLRLRAKTPDQLHALLRDHSSGAFSHMFASRVIVAAIRDITAAWRG